MSRIRDGMITPSRASYRKGPSAIPAEVDEENQDLSLNVDLHYHNQQPIKVQRLVRRHDLETDTLNINSNQGQKSDFLNTVDGVTAGHPALGG